ncbi:hypothetical protein V8C86DRAFT_2484451 [Haematococcus lacustris]
MAPTAVEGYGRDWAYPCVAAPDVFHNWTAPFLPITKWHAPSQNHYKHCTVLLLLLLCMQASGGTMGVGWPQSPPQPVTPLTPKSCPPSRCPPPCQHCSQAPRGHPTSTTTSSASRPGPLGPGMQGNQPSQLSPPASPRCDSAFSSSDSPSTWAGSDPHDTESGAGSRAALQCKITAAGADSCTCQGLQPGSLAQPQPGSDPASPLQTCASSAELELDSCRVISGPCRLSACGTSAVMDDVISSLLDKAADQGPGVRGMGSGSLLLGADHPDRQTSQHTHPCHPNSAPAVAVASQAGQGHCSALNAVAKVDGLSQLPLGQQNSSAADHSPASRLQSRPATGKADVMLQAVNQAV